MDFDLGGRLPLLHAVGIALKITEALQELAEQNVAHLSLKPNNTLLDASRQQAVLSDFGINQAMQQLPNMPLAAVSVQIKYM